MPAFRLTYPTATVLLAVQAGHRYGFDVMDATGLPDGTVYPILRRLEQKGAITGRWELEEEARADRRPPRRYYQLTPQGVEAVELAMARFPMLGRLMGLAGDPVPE
ncbi:MAG: PadR family transcriptional regulator [Gemmatimonadetes bacterium]|nr:PadR family transcriptional regulator [Gemmatimonadota bacterium]